MVFKRAKFCGRTWLGRCLVLGAKFFESVGLWGFMVAMHHKYTQDVAAKVMVHKSFEEWWFSREPSLAVGLGSVGAWCLVPKLMKF